METQTVEPTKEIVTYHPNGKVQLRYSILQHQKDIQFHGPFRQYDKDGNLTLEANYMLGFRHNDYLVYEKGKLVIEAKYHKGQQIKYIVHGKKEFDCND